MSDKDLENAANKPLCKYGTECYQRNKNHLEKYEHPQESEREILPPAKKLRVAHSSLKQQKLSAFFRTNASKNLKNEIPSTADQTIEKESSDPRRCDVTGELTSKNESVEESKSEKISSPTDTIKNDNWQQIIKKLFFVTMPDDFVSLWEFCRSISPENPRDALKTINLELVGPFDVLSGDMTDDIESSVACRHWRYFYDPPEFQTVLKANRPDLLHFGYYRDDPEELPVFVGYNKAAKDVVITAVGENIFAAIRWERSRDNLILLCIIEAGGSRVDTNIERHSTNDEVWYINHSLDTSSPFHKMQLSSLKNGLHKWAKDHAYSLISCTENIRKRNKNVVSKTFHQAGIVVPYEKKTELGYRPLAKTSTELMKILNQIENSKTDEQKMAHLNELHEVITWTNIAVDEGDVGTALELGINLFCFDSKLFDKMILQQLTSAYQLLKRNAFATIIKAHLTHRKKGGDLSVLKK